MKDNTQLISKKDVGLQVVEQNRSNQNGGSRADIREDRRRINRLKNNQISQHMKDIEFLLEDLFCKLVKKKLYNNKRVNQLLQLIIQLHAHSSKRECDTLIFCLVEIRARNQ